MCDKKFSTISPHRQRYILLYTHITNAHHEMSSIDKLVELKKEFLHLLQDELQKITKNF